MRPVYLFILVSFVFISGSTAQRIKVKGVSRKGNGIKTVPVSQPNYNIMQLTGKWQEIIRTSLSAKTEEAFSDTLQLNFNKRDSVFVREGMVMSKRGYAAVEAPDQLQVAGDMYTIVSLSKNMLRINDGEFIRVLQKKNLFYYETLGRVIIPKENLTEPIHVNTKNLAGKWEVYRTQAVPGMAADSAVIKEINFEKQNADGSLSGLVVFTKMHHTGSVPFNAVFSKGSMQLVTNDQTWQLATYKADGKEFVFGQQGGLVYFAKQL